ncbi:OmpA family protein [Oceanomicrobium pacificus]|uniref:OmpA family protein n=1 Tax=Oceanomicrobium pacificus TaxID=2692916 RepID=A0A6B0TVQ5_9RHOB|nr:OmpA family protein [Oceanomicrobium pacificus]MXU66789.1 OmpA family protein [Oceanomicrobium pacificus]
MRFIAPLFALVSLALCALAANYIATRTVAHIETTTQARITTALRAAGEDWAKVDTDGSIVRLSGEAQDEGRRFRAREIALQLVSARRIVDEVTIAPKVDTDVPEFTLEILRNLNEVSLIGLVPTDNGRGPVMSALDALGSSDVTDMLDEAQYDVPDGWGDSLDFGLQLLAELDRTKISITPGRVIVSAVALSDAERRDLSAKLNGLRPESVELALNISAPRPVITPFELTYRLEDGTGELAPCVALTEEGRNRILRTAAGEGTLAPPACRVGLGAPTPLWPQAVGLGISAVKSLGGGSITFRDTDVVLDGPLGADPDEFAQVTEDLRAALPPLFSLSATLPEPEDSTNPGGRVSVPTFVAELTPERTVILRGSIQDSMSQKAVETYAASLFGFGQVEDRTRVIADMPAGWPGRVLSGIEALSLLNSGQLIVTPGNVSVSGRSASESIDEEMSDVLRLRLGADARFTTSVVFDPALVVEEAQPDQTDCGLLIEEILNVRQITFAPSSDEIDAESQQVIDEIAAVLRLCPGAPFEVAGHTDSQGGELSNQALSQRRADAVLDALLEREVPTSSMTAKGYGEAVPIADNGTEEGRQINRRIEFTLIEDDPEGDADGGDAADTDVTGGTDPAAEADAAEADGAEADGADGSDDGGDGSETDAGDADADTAAAEDSDATTDDTQTESN